MASPLSPAGMFFLWARGGRLSPARPGGGWRNKKRRRIIPAPKPLPPPASRPRHSVQDSRDVIAGELVGLHAVAEFYGCDPKDDALKPLTDLIRRAAPGFVAVEHEHHFREMLRDQILLDPRQDGSHERHARIPGLAHLHAVEEPLDDHHV